ncbi:PGF-pre-PGF domain-containing protein [Candidatus Woesearchaeota archaeon]|nr:PGF-pre-PGF domain-containing protein [Candidatus Woesearchaeota archaeon]
MSKEGKTNIRIILASVLLLSVMAFLVSGFTVTVLRQAQNSSGSFLNVTLQNSFQNSTSVSFNITILNTTAEFNITIVNVTVHYNGTNVSGGYETNVLCFARNRTGGGNNSVNVTIGDMGGSTNDSFNCTGTVPAGNWTIYAMIYNITSSDGIKPLPQNFTAHSFVVDTKPPAVMPIQPFSTNDPTTVNFTSFPVLFYVNVSRNVTATDQANANISDVWYILYSAINGGGTAETYNGSQLMNLSNKVTDEAVLNYTIPSNGSHGGLVLKFLSLQRSPGAHSVQFCANDSAGNINCTTPVNYIVKGGNLTDLQQVVGGAANTTTAWGSLTFFYENYTALTGFNPSDPPHFFAPTLYNYTMRINITANGTAVALDIVGMQINESLMADMNKVNTTAATPANLRNATGGQGFSQAVGWLEVGSFLPSFAFYKYGAITYWNKAPEQMFRCNGSFGDPSCWRINACPSAPYITGHNNSNYSFIATQTGYNSTANLTVGSCYVLGSPNTTIYVSQFSGASASDDATGPTVTLNTPTNASNISDTTPFINITLNDTGVGLPNGSFVNITIASTTYTYPDNVSCTPVTINATGKICTITATHPLPNNASTNFTVIVDDAVGNRRNISVIFKVDSLAPRYIVFNITNQSSGNTSLNLTGCTGGDGCTGGVTVKALGSDLSASIKQGQNVSVWVQWNDTIPGDGIDLLGINNMEGRTAYLEVLNLTDNNWYVVNSTLVAGNWTNLTWLIPAEHSFAEGANITLRVNLTDFPGGNLNSTNTSNVSSNLSEGGLSRTNNMRFLVNDTQAPNITIRIGASGALLVNGSTYNLSGTSVIVNWSTNDLGGVKTINVSFDNANQSSDSETGCGVYYTVPGSISTNRDRQVQYPAAGCAASVGTAIVSGSLANGSHTANITVVDAWNNVASKQVTFNIDNQPPGIQLNLTDLGVDNANLSSIANITSSRAIQINVSEVGTAGFGNVTYNSTCNTTTVVLTSSSDNNSIFQAFQPFNTAGCKSVAGQHNVTVRVTDTAGNTNTTRYFFNLDEVAPTANITTPSANQLISGAEAVQINWTASDAFGNISNIVYYLDNTSTARSLRDGSEDPDSRDNGGTNLSFRLEAGTHTFKLSVNDSSGNVVNQSVTFTILGVVNMSVVRVNINNSVSSTSMENLDVEIQRHNGAAYVTATDNQTINTTHLFNVVVRLNNTITLIDEVTTINVTIADINGSKANWNNSAMPAFVNDSTVWNLTSSVYTLEPKVLVFANGSMDRFVSNDDDYFGIVRLPGNKTENYHKIYWFADENVYNTTTAFTELSACSAGSTFTAKTSTPCYTENVTFTLVYVPHFSIVLAANDTTAPRINPNFNTSTKGSISNSSFVVAFTTSLDAVSCHYTVNSSTLVNQSMTISGTSGNKTCTGGLTNISNGTSINTTINFTVSDGNNSRQELFTINVSDMLYPGFNASHVKNTSIGNDSAVITWNTTEFTNSTVTVQAVTSSSPTNFTSVQLVMNHSITLTGLSASTKYNFTIRHCDFSGNCNTSAGNSSGESFNFTTSASAASAASSTTSSSSGGGGGGAATPATTNVEASKAQVFSAVAAGASATVNVNNAKIAVTQVAVTVAKDVANVEVKVSSLKDKPTSSAPAEKVYQYLDIAPTNLGASDVSKVNIAFKVTKAWLASSGVSASDVALARYSAGSWNTLATTKVSEDDTSVSYSAESPGFSYYAVISKAAETPEPEVKPEEKPVQPVEKPREGVVEKVKEGIGEVAGQVAEKAQGLSKTAWTWIIVLALAAAGLVAYFVYARKQQ